MFINYETLTCDVCQKEFIGRRPAEGGSILCQECLKATELLVLDLKKKDEIPPEVLSEIDDGKGEDE